MRRRRIALANRRSTPPGTMNKTEVAYAACLKGRKEVVAVEFESLKLRLADKTWYTPDFYVLLDDGSVELHEVKGGWVDQKSRVKIKVAAEAFPEFKFWWVVGKPKAKRDGGGWGWLKAEVKPR